MSISPRNSIAVEPVPVSQLAFDPRNARVHDKRQVKQIAQSLANFGFNVPVLADSNNKILAGHGRVLAAKQLGWNEVPVIRLHHLSQAQARAFAIADNRLSETSFWDERLLGEVLAELSLQELDFEIEATGFTMGEIDLRIETLTPPNTNSQDLADRVVEPPDQPPIGNIGDMWALGPHRVLCADAREAIAYEKLLERQRAAMIFTDPPYNVAIAGNVSGKGGIHHREFAMACGEMASGEFADFLTTICRQLSQHSESGSLQYICMDWRHMREMLIAGERAFSELKNLCIWNKTNAGMGSLYRSQHELVFVFKNGTASHRNNVQLGKYGRNRTNVWTYAGPNNFGRGGEEGNLAALHPTVKPVALIADAILDCTSRGGIILDPFLGSGSTLIAAERVGRRCYGMEIDPLYVDTAIRRWQQHTGQDAIHATSGKRFNELMERDVAND